MSAAPKTAQKGSFLTSIVRRQIFIPIAALLILAIFNFIMDPSFFKITLGHNSEGDPILSGNLISIIDYGSELAILAIGMTLVTAASRGQDISVGAAIAISGSVVLRVLCGTNSRPDTLQAPIIVAFLISCLVAMAFGAFNGTLVSVFKIQPMVATLILFTAGRSIAAWINNNELPVVSDRTFTYFGGYIPGIPIPTPFFIAIACFILTWLALKFTNLGLYVQSVGINEGAARLNGINPVLIKMLSFVILGVCVAVAGVIGVSRIGQIAHQTLLGEIEMDAILAVAIGGNSLGGGRFRIVGSVLGAYIIKMLTITLYAMNVAPVNVKAYKAIVIILIVVAGSPVIRSRMTAMRNKMKAKREASAAKGVG